MRYHRPVVLAVVSTLLLAACDGGSVDNARSSKPTDKAVTALRQELGVAAGVVSSSERTAAQAQAALGVFRAIAKDPETWTRASEPVTDGVIDVAIRWVDSFGLDPPAARARAARDEPADHVVEITQSAQKSVLRFISGTGDEDAVRFRAAARWDTLRQLGQTMRADDSGQLKDTLERTGRQEGLIAGAEIEHQSGMASGDDTHDTYSSAERDKAASQLAATVGPTVAAGAGTFAGASELVRRGFLDRLLGSPRTPTASPEKGIDLANGLRSAAHNNAASIQRLTIVQAALDAGRIHGDDLPPGDYTERDDRVVLRPDLSAEDLKDAYFDLDIDEGSYQDGWQAGFDA